MRWRAIAVVVLVIVAAPLVGALVPRPLVQTAESGTAATRRILVLSNPIHTDIALPADADVLRYFGFIGQSGLPLADPRVRWIVLGWGGRSFYLETPTWSELKAGPVLRALTVDTSVMHVAVAGSIHPAGEGVTAVDLDEHRFAELIEATMSAFARSEGGEPILVAGRSYGDYDRFYEAEGRFNALLGCNTWTSAVLRRAGLRTGWWNPLPQSLVWSLRAFNDLP